METKNTNIFEKLLPSVVNAVVVFTASLPLIYIWGFTFWYKLVLVLIFWFYNLFFILFYKNRCLGMMLSKTSWDKEYPLQNQLIYSVFYTLSFATVVIWWIFPFDLLLFNLVFVQLPFVIKTGTTLHGYLGGHMITVKKSKYFWSH